MAIKFHLPDGSEQLHLICYRKMSSSSDREGPTLGFAPGGRRAVRRAQADAGGKFLSTHPAAVAFVTTPKPVAVSYGSQPFFGVNAFKFTNAQGAAKFGRYRIVPEDGPAYVSDEGSDTPSSECTRRQFACSA